MKPPQTVSVVHKFSALLCATAVLVVCAHTDVRASSTMRLSVKVEPSAWGSGQFKHLLEDAMNRSFSDRELRWEETESGWLVVPTEPIQEKAKNGKGNQPELRSLAVSIVVHPYELVTKKTFDAPGLFHNYGVFGQARVKLRVIERSSGKILADEEIVESKRGPKVLQLSIDADKFDPDLQMTALVKHRFFEAIERTVADAVATRLAQIAK